jgi:hypothetical protein
LVAEPPRGFLAAVSAYLAATALPQAIGTLSDLLGASV